MSDPVTCTEEYWPDWSSRGMRAMRTVRCDKPAKETVAQRKYHGDVPRRPVCGVHARMYPETREPIA